LGVGGESIFLLEDGRLGVLQARPYESEAVLQRVLAEHPEVIAGPTTLGDTPAGLVLVRQEMGVPTKDGGSAAFSLDHLSSTRTASRFWSR
jgi:hypothetical protein